MTIEQSTEAGHEMAASLRSWLSSVDVEQLDALTPLVWGRLAALGALGISSPAAGGDAVVGAIVAEELGRHLVGGPIVATTLAAHALPATDADAVVAGTLLATYGADGRFPWGEQADILLDVTGGAVWRVSVTERHGVVGTMAGEPWLLADVVPMAELSNSAVALAHAEVVLAAYLTGAAAGLIDRAAAHARERRQFGRPIGDFQAVSHTLAECFARTSAATALNRAIAARLVQEQHRSADSALALLSATRAAVRAARVAHQVFGALGYSVEGGVARYSNRIRQWSLLGPAPGTAHHRIARRVVENAAGGDGRSIR